MGMKGKWRSLAYLDLYAGTGQSRVPGTNVILLGSPLIALSLDIQFDQYVFCEKNQEKLEALKERVVKRFSQASVKIIHGDCDDPTFQIGGAIPRTALPCASLIHTALAFTSRRFALCLKAEKSTFCVCLASRMDAGRNPHNYPKEECKKVDLLLGTETWRDDWEKLKEGLAREPNLGDFICREFSRKMEGYGVPANRIT